MRFLKPAMVIGSAAVMVLGFAGPASAAEKTAVDVRGDASARYDVTKVQFRHNDNGAHATIHVRNLRKRGQLVFAVANRRNSVRFGVAATGHANGSVTKKFYRYRHGEVSRKRCSATRVGWHPRRDVVTMSFPVRCYRALPKRVVMAVGSTKHFPSGTTVDQGPTVIL
ncbi:MAG TPA: hypothetical protein VKB55_09350 [Nocardioidaceae bacterium]|nr:hypothetical protein [Nocardioidaceae bacterium]